MLCFQARLQLKQSFDRQNNLSLILQILVFGTENESQDTVSRPLCLCVYRWSRLVLLMLVVPGSQRWRGLASGVFTCQLASFLITGCSLLSEFGGTEERSMSFGSSFDSLSIASSIFDVCFYLWPRSFFSLIHETLIKCLLYKFGL